MMLTVESFFATFALLPVLPDCFTPIHEPIRSNTADNNFGNIADTKGSVSGTLNISVIAAEI